MQRLPSGFAALLSIFALTTLPACKGEKTDDKTDAASAKSSDDGKAEAGAAEAGLAEGGAAEAGAAEAGAEAGAPEAGVAEGGAEAGAAEAGAAEAGAAEAGAPEQDPVPALLEQAKSLDTEDEAAKKALDDAIAAGAAKLDVAKVANARGEALLTKGESERAEVFFTWARDAHNLYADPVYNLAKLSAYAGDLELAKEHLQELQKRGNKKLMKKVGVDPAFAPLHDDPDVRKIYEQ